MAPKKGNRGRKAPAPPLLEAVGETSAAGTHAAIPMTGIPSGAPQTGDFPLNPPTARELTRSKVPDDACHYTQENLQSDHPHIKGMDDCPLCAENGISCCVASHSFAAPAGIHLFFLLIILFLRHRVT